MSNQNRPTLTRIDSCWALPPSWKAVLESSLRLRFLQGHIISGIDETLAVAGPLAAPVSVSQPTAESTVAVIPVVGAVSYRADWFTEIFGGATVSSIARQLRRAAADPSVKTIVMPIDSPGGSVYGLQELAAIMRDVRATKPIITVADPMAASAAYWIASQGTEVHVTPSGETGSIGVFVMHMDLSKALEGEGVKITFVSQGKFKTEANPYEPLADEALASIQKTVDHYYNQFVSDIAKGRNVGTKDVRNGYGEGRLLTAPDSLAAGMVDKVSSLADSLDRALAGRWKPAMQRAAEVDLLERAAEAGQAVTLEMTEPDADRLHAGDVEPPSHPPAEIFSLDTIIAESEPDEPIQAAIDEPEADGFAEIMRGYVDLWEEADAAHR